LSAGAGRGDSAIQPWKQARDGRRSG